MSKVSNKERRTKTRKFMIFVIVFLYILATIFVATDWALVVGIHIKGSEVDANLVVTSVYKWGSGITSGISTSVLALPIVFFLFPFVLYLYVYPTR